MSLIEELRAERKARLIRLGAAPHRRAVKTINKVVAEQAGLIAEIKEDSDIPNVLAAWVQRQKAITKELRSSIQENQHTRPSVATIQMVTAVYFGVDRHDMLSARRTSDIVYPRQVAYYLCKTLTLRTLPDIAGKFGGRDHTTILHGIRKIQRLILMDWEAAYDVAQIEASLQS